MFRTGGPQLNKKLSFNKQPILPLKGLNKSFTTKPQTYSKTFLQNLPKVDLHCHLDGSIRLQTVYDIAKRRKLNLPHFPSGYFPSFDELTKVSLFPLF